jgi:hypothetical protein
MAAISFTHHIDLSTRRKRKDATAFVIDIIHEIYEAELVYKERYLSAHGAYVSVPTTDRLFEAMWTLFTAFD